MRPDAHRHGCDLVEGFARKLRAGSVTIRLARADDLATLVEIERAASEMFRSLGIDVVADDDPVHPDHARQGIGRALIEHAAQWARARGLPALTLTTCRGTPPTTSVSASAP